MNENIAIKVENVSKTFKIPHEKINFLRGAFVNLFKKKSYEKFEALNDVSFEVKKGEFFGIIGRNGSGKSTLLKILAGIYEADKGKININGRISPFLELGIGFNPELSGRDNIYLNATVLGLTRKQIDKKFNDIVAFSELERFIDQKLKNYSSGMQVRLAFSVAIHANRDILLMDEVLAVGDANFQYKCLAEFTKYRDLGKTVILVTHDISTVQHYCDRTMLLRNGKIEMIGKSEKVSVAYIRENIVDEEKRLTEEEKKKDDNIESVTEKEKSENHFGRRLKITSVDFIDKEGNKKHIFKEDELIVARINFDNKMKLNEAVFGIEFFSETGSRLFGTHTRLYNYSVPLRGINFVDFEFNSGSLLDGKYFISPAVAENNCKVMIDYVDKEYYFCIKSNRKDEGYANIRFKWKINNKEKNHGKF